MSFSEKAKLIALAIVHIFETSKPFGEFDTYAVLDDGAGFLSTIAAKIAGMPDWLVFLLGALTGIALWNFFVLIIKYRQTVGEFLIKCYEATANPQMHNLIPTPTKEYAGFFQSYGTRRAELLSALADKR